MCTTPVANDTAAPAAAAPAATQPKVCEAVRIAKERYLSSPLMVDPEYILAYTKAHRELAPTIRSPVELRAECHARAMEAMTPCILPHEMIVGRKSKYTRGAIPYLNYASKFVLCELTQLQQEAQDAVTEVGSGGGIAIGRQLADAKDSEYAHFGKKFLLKKTDLPALKEAAAYWQDKCMQAVGDKLWKKQFSGAQYIEDGWQAVLFTAAHDPAPEGRCVLDFESAIGRGLEAIAEEAEMKAKSIHVTDHTCGSKIEFWLAASRVLRATIAWARKYAAEARRLAAEPGRTEEERKELLEIAERCEHVPAKPPRNFAEAVQSYWFIYCAGHMEGAYLGFSPGRFDQYMYPYFLPDWKSGKLTEQAAIDMLAYLRIKHTELEYVSSFSWEGLGSGNLFQNMMLGGLLADGKPGDNELSILVVEAAIRCKTTQPTLSVWYVDTLSDKFLMKAAACVKTGVGFPAWFNFACYAQHELQATGLPLSVIRRYAAMGGCTEPLLEGRSYGIVQPGFINLCKVFELAMFGGKDPRTGIQFSPATPVPKTSEELFAAFQTHLATAIKNWTSYWNYVMYAHKETCLMVFASALTLNCIESGLSLDEGGALVNCTPTTLSTGMVNVANCFAGVHNLVDDGVCSMNQLRTALLNNWKDADNLHSLALRAPKWGNDLDQVDQIFVKLFNYYCETVSKQINFLGKPYDPSMLAISTHAPFGRACFATPDGRNQGETLADGVTSPMYGTDVSGPFSVLLSCSKVDHTKIRGGLHNMKLSPGTLRGNAGSRKFLNLVASYFKSTMAFQLQFNVVDTATLRDAQKHPENYRDLIVRVAGFSAYFCELSKPIQDEVIARTEHTLGAASSEELQKALEKEMEEEDSHDGVLASTVGKIFDIQDFTLHDGPGIRTTVFLKGCPLCCKWCCNPESQSPEIEDQNEKLGGRKITAGELVSTLTSRTRFHANGGVTLSGGEPMAQPEFANAVCKLLAHRGVPITIETSGMFKWDSVRPAIETASLVYFDIKAASPEVHKSLTGVDNRVILTNLAHVVKTLGGSKIIVSVPVVPSLNDSDAEITAIAKLVKEAGVSCVRLLPYHQLGKHKYEMLKRQYTVPESVKTPSSEELTHLKSIFTAMGLDCNIVNSI